MFDVVIADGRYPRDGRFIEKIGIYNPNTNPATIELNENKAFDWVMKGAQPTDTVKAMLSYKGILLKKHLQIGVNKGAITQEQADLKYAEWISGKTSKIEGKKSKLAADKEKDKKARIDAEIKVNAAREEALKNKDKLVEETTEVATVETEAIAEPVAEAQIETMAEAEAVSEPTSETTTEATAESTEDKTAAE